MQAAEGVYLLIVMKNFKSSYILSLLSYPAAYIITIIIAVINNLCNTNILFYVDTTQLFYGIIITLNTIAIIHAINIYSKMH